MQNNQIVPAAPPPVACMPAEKPAFNKALLLWPACGALMIALLWAGVFSLIEKERSRAESDGWRRVKMLANGYAEQVRHSLEQIERFTLDLQYEWETKQSDIDLDNRYRRGLYPSTSELYITLVDKQGMSGASTLGTHRMDLSDRDYFLVHKEDPSNAMRVGEALQKGRASGQYVMRFSRRLTDENGNFDGVALVSVYPEYFTSFNDDDSLGPHDLVSIRHEKGELLVSEKG